MHLFCLVLFLFLLLLLLLLLFYFYKLTKKVFNLSKLNREILKNTFLQL